MTPDCPVNAFGGCACVDLCKNTPTINLDAPSPDQENMQ